MLFTPNTLFKSVPCPADEACVLLNCMFAHAEVVTLTAEAASTATYDQSHDQPALKKRKLSEDVSQNSLYTKTASAEARFAASTIEGLAKPEPQSNRKLPAEQGISTLKRPISPPVTTPKTVGATQDTIEVGLSTKATPQIDAAPIISKHEHDAVTLNPREVNPAPDTHAKRLSYLKIIFSDMQELDRKARTRNTALGGIEAAEIRKMARHESVLIGMAIGEEEEVARKHSRLYANKIRHRIQLYKKMTLEQWIEKIQSMAADAESTPADELEVKPGAATKSKPRADYKCKRGPRKSGKYFKSSLSQSEEVALLPHMIVRDQSSLAQYGYVEAPPDEHYIDMANKFRQMLGYVEECDRCGSKFKVFPPHVFPHGDPETGKLTSRGPCLFHPRKRVDNETQTYACCGQELGAAGCKTYLHHVFKCRTKDDLAAVLPFITTPENLHRRVDEDGHAPAAVVFDCEMGYTTQGFEMLRLTAISWPTGSLLIDVLVRPCGRVLDYNSQFSGVDAEQYSTTPPYHEGQSPTILSVVDNPAIARDLLCSYLAPDTPLIGHAIENDLQVARLCHPTIIDTVLLYPHHMGLPYRNALRYLAKAQLGQIIQSPGYNGHDSYEDCMATGDLVRAKAQSLFGDLKREGWVMEGSKLQPPGDHNGEIGCFVVKPKKQHKSKQDDTKISGVSDYVKEMQPNDTTPAELDPDFLES